MPSSPRVLQVVLQLNPGGTERLVVEIVRRLHRRFPMAVCCLDAPGQWADRLTAIGVEVIALQRQAGFQLGLARGVARVARHHRSTVLHCHHYSPFVYGRLASVLVPGSRVVFTEHGRLSDAPPSAKRRLATSLLTAGVSQLYAVSHDLRSHLLAEGFPERLAVIRNGIDAATAPSAAARDAARAALGVDRDVRLIGSVGRLDPVKDLRTLIGAFATAHRADSRVRLVILGDGPERAALEALIDAAGLADRARLLGHREDVAALLPGFDIYANSSITEGISLTILEAMAAERPVVVTSVGGNPEIVEHNVTGLLRPARDAEALAEALLLLSANPVLAARLGKAGRERVLAQFTLDQMVERYAQIYESA